MTTFVFGRFLYRVEEDGVILHKPNKAGDWSWAPSAFISIHRVGMSSDWDSEYREFIVAYDFAMKPKHPVELF